MADIFPESREEEILVSMIDGEEYNKAPESRIEALLLELKEVIEEGGGGGTTNYNLLQNKPSINSVTLTGNKSLEDLSIPTASDLAGKQDVLPVAASGNDVAFNGDIQDGQGNTLSVLAEALTKTASGNPVVITDCAGGKARSLITEIEPIQDLHGLPFPYVGGAYKNLVELHMTSREIYGVTYTKNSDGSFTLNGTATGNINFRVDQDNTGSVVNPKTWAAGTYAMSKSTTKFRLVVMQDRTFTTIMSLEANDTSGTVTLADTVDNCFTFIAINSGTRFDNEKFYIQIEKGNQATAWTPWENICPISGRTAVAVDDTGRNIWDEQWEVGAINDTTGEIVSGNRISSSHYIKVSHGVEYYITFPDRLADDIKLYYYDKDYNYLGTSTWLRRGTVTFADNVAYFRFNMATAYGLTYGNDICINISDASFNGQYVPYQHSSVTIQLGQTVYGADINWDTGVMTVTDAIVDLGTLTYSKDTTTRPADGATINAFYATLSGAKKYDNAVVADVKCSQYVAASVREIDYGGWTSIKDGIVGGADANSRIWIYDSQYASYTGATFKAAMSGVQLCYKLATPIELTLTPTEVQMLKGYNRVTIDNGSIELGYIAKAISGNDEEIAPLVGDKATKSYAVNDFIERNDGLYRVTAPIASGASFTANNTVKMSMGEALTYLYNK